jgi:hypothetical protein
MPPGGVLWQGPRLVRGQAVARGLARPLQRVVRDNRGQVSLGAALPSDLGD